MRPEPVGGGEVKLEIRFSTIRLMRDKTRSVHIGMRGKFTYLAFFRQATTSGGSSLDVTLAFEFDMVTLVLEISLR